ncbi:autophagy-related protein 36-like isoform X2 [Dendrobium catenatum]|uniref:autophagy-related protein 36-like isoform X2 n=1 Tax=Dendrobium catenatum TaxID=906689 RepID=UPI0010A096FA|nr:autophagy-related protein 36-like isoform X2 [Dendrobium catenatum]
MDASGLPIKRQRTPSPKGKEKMGEAAIGDGAVCGICFSDGGLAARGWIDSCDHYFCFVCIMEWAKVESRCPMCKQRFRFIRRPEVSGGIAESALEIPVRDQVYHPLGNESSALYDLYAQASCRVCHGSNDDELLLLCDLCDSAFHTYCVRLGYTVPEDDWYCHDCTIMREEHAKIDGDTNDTDQDQGTVVLDQQQPASVFDILADERSSTIEQQHFHDRPVSKSSTNIQMSFEDIMLHAEESDSSCSASQGTDMYLQRSGVGQTARTFQHSCNMQSRVQDLRKNWTALQSGSLAFSSTLDSNGATMSGVKQRTSRTNSDLSQQSKSSTLVDNERLTDSSTSSKISAISDSQDVEKAWKMMQRAKKHRLANSSLNSPRYNNSLNSAGAISASKGPEVSPVRLSKFHEVKCSSLSSATCEAARKSSGVCCTKKLTLDGNETASGYTGRTSSKGYEISNNNVKSEIQSMVKLNLQRLSKGERLGTERFKEIARASTHSILAACGLEHSKSCARPFSNQVCRHTSQIKQLHESTLMPGSCKECFHSFVKYVVKSILLEKSTSSSR